MVEISDSEEEEVVILHPEEPAKAPKLVHFFATGYGLCTCKRLFFSQSSVVCFSRDEGPSSQQKGAATSKRKQKKR